MNADTGEIQELGLDCEPLKANEVEVTEAQKAQLEPMNRAQRRAWAKGARRHG